MTNQTDLKVAILYPGDSDARKTATPQTSRFLPVFQALAGRGMQVEAAVYHDDFTDAVRAQLMRMNGVLVWVNPYEGGRDRSRLDAMLRDVAAGGVYVSTHPDVILKLGTKEVLVQTRAMGWGASDTQSYRTGDQLRHAVGAQMAAGRARVLKQYRGNGGNGVWKIEPEANFLPGQAGPDAASDPLDMPVRVRHAKRGSLDEIMPLGTFLKRCEPYFEGEGRVINQAYQARLPEGMVRCYLVQDKVAGFGHQAVNALCPAPADAPPGTAPATTPRLYYPPDLPRFQTLKRQLETTWVPQLQELLEIGTTSLPIIWDCDFLLGEKTRDGDDTHVLCEINVSCVSPFHDSALDIMASATLERIREARHLRNR